MPFKKGQSGNPNGRGKGVKNKFTTLKQSFLNVYERLGGDDGLFKWASDPKNQGFFYEKVAKMLPREVEQKNSGRESKSRSPSMVRRNE